MSFKNILAVEQQASRFKSRIIAGLFLVIIVMSIGWAIAPNQITLHYPPDLRSGATMKIGVVDSAGVYLFAEYLMQQINHWPTNGVEDYQANINRFRDYITPAYYADLQQDYKDRKQSGELKKRVRNWSPVPDTAYDDSYVEPLGKGWLVWLDVHIEEYIHGGLVKNLYLKIPIHVVPYDVDREKNPWGLALAGSAQQNPIKLDSGGAQ